MHLRTTVAGLLLMTLGEAWRIWGVATAGNCTRRRTREVSGLVTHGPFAWSRNPLYNGNFFVWMGVVTLSGATWFLPIAIVIFAIEYFFIVRFEEGVLESFFGQQYLEYKASTPRWFPRPPSGNAEGEYFWSEAWHSEASTFLQYVVIIAVFTAKEWFWIR